MSIIKSLSILAALALLSACGEPPPVELTTSQRQLIAECLSDARNAIYAPCQTYTVAQERAYEEWAITEQARLDAEQAEKMARDDAEMVSLEADPVFLAEVECRRAGGSYADCHDERNSNLDLLMYLAWKADKAAAAK